MARKRKTTENEVVSATTEERLHTAIYGRLSSERDDDREETQIELVREFIDNREDLEYVDTYFDNGFTGTNFDRPAFNRLIKDVRSGRINCIVVKDLSRFGRNYLEAGYYIENIFPFLGVRLLSVTDNFDSDNKEDMDGLLVPIRNIVNTMYAKDISKKIWTSIQQERINGSVRLGGFAPYGYVREIGQQKFEINSDSAFIVELIFMWYVIGVPLYVITKRLNICGVPTPSMHYKSLFPDSKRKVSLRWLNSRIISILRDPVYTGATVFGKTSQAFFAGKSIEYIKHENWTTIPDTHSAIITREDFDSVQSILKKRNLKNNKRWKNSREMAGQRNNLHGLVFCGGCGRILVFGHLKYGTGKDGFFGKYSCGTNSCIEHCRECNISETLLKTIIVERLREYLNALWNKRLQMQEDSKNPNFVNRKITELKGQEKTVARHLSRLYEDLVCEIIDMDEYELYRKNLLKKSEEIKNSIKSLQKEQSDKESKVCEFMKMTDGIDEYLQIDTFDESLARRFIKKIVVGANNKVDIIFNGSEEN